MDFTISQIKQARTYVPMSEKVAFVEHAAARCRVQVQVGAENDTQSKALPNMYMENTERKMRYMMGALLKLYMGVDFEGAENDPYLLSLADYDRYGSAHILNQIERMKTEADVRARCFDLLQDYRALEKMLNAEIYGMLQVQNDPITRFLAYNQTLMTPEYMNELAQDLSNAKNELAAYLVSRKSGGEDGQ